MKKNILGKMQNFTNNIMEKIKTSKLLVLIGASFLCLCVIGYMYIRQPNWLVLNEKDEYVHIIKESKKPTILFVAPFNKDFWPGVMNVSSLSEYLKKIEGKVGVIAPMSLPQILESMQQVRRQYNLNFDIYLMPDSLFYKFFNANGADLEAQETKHGFYLFCQNGKELLRMTEDIRFLSEPGIKIVNKTFNANLNIFGI